MKKLFFLFLILVNSSCGDTTTNITTTSRTTSSFTLSSPTDTTIVKVDTVNSLIQIDTVQSNALVLKWLAATDMSSSLLLYTAYIDKDDTIANGCIFSIETTETTASIPFSLLRYNPNLRRDTINKLYYKVYVSDGYENLRSQNVISCKLKYQ